MPDPAAVGADAPLLDDNNPWPGLASFTEATSGFFHGRDRETTELLLRVRRERLTVLFGQSGLGKTSLLRAGLLPRLGDELLPVYLRLDLAGGGLPPARQVLAALADSLAANGIEVRPPHEQETLWAYLHARDAELWTRRHRLVIPVLVLDQFEEVFTLGREARSTGDFLTQLGDLAENRAPAAVKAQLEADLDEPVAYDFGRDSCRIVLSLREDFLPDLEGLRPRMPSIMANRMRLTRMNGGQALDAVLLSGRHLIAEAVAGEVIAYVATGRRAEGAVPRREEDLARLEIEPALLSVVCRELNNKRMAAGQPQITSDLLVGARSEIITEFYRSCLADLGAPVKDFIEEELLTAAGYRDSRPLEEAIAIPGIDRDTIDKLVHRRLLRIEERHRTQWVELTHDLLTDVIAQQRDLRRAQLRVEQAARAAERRAREERQRAEDEQAARAEQREREVQRELAKAATARAETALRLVRQSRLALVLLSVMLVVAIASIYYAIRARQTAEQAYAAASGAVEKNVGLISTYLNPVVIGQQRILELLTSERHLLDPLPDDVTAARSRFRLFINLADAQLALGQLDEARNVTQQALDEADLLLKADPADDTAIEYVWRGYETAGQVWLAEGNTQQAIENYGRARDLAGRNARRAPNEPAWAHRIAESDVNIGRAMIQEGDFAAACDAFKHALAAAEPAADKKPVDAGIPRTLVEAHLGLSEGLQKMNQPEAALGHLESALQLAEAVPEGGDDWQFELAKVHQGFGDLKEMQDDLPAARQELDQAEAILQTIVDRKDNSAIYWSGLQALSINNTKVATVLKRQDKLDDALQRFQAAFDIRQQLVKHDPSNSGWQRNLWASQSYIGEVLAAKGDLDGALDRFSTALQDRQAQINRESSNDRSRRDVAITYCRIGSVYAAQGQAPAAQDSFRRAIAIMAPLVSSHPRNATWQAELEIDRRHARALGLDPGRSEPASVALDPPPAKAAGPGLDIDCLTS